MKHLSMNHLPDSPREGHSPLAQAGSLQPPVGGLALSITEKVMLGHLVIRGDSDAPELARAIHDLLGLRLPSAPLQSCEDEHQGRVLRWVSPDEWLLTLPGENLTEVEAGLRARLDERFAIVDVSGGQTMLHLSGEDAELVLRKSTSYDVHLVNFPEGKTVIITFARSQVMLRRLSADSFELIVRRSFADYIWRWIHDAASEDGSALRKGDN